MLVYAIILFAVSALFFACGVPMARGSAKLIHDYHQERVREEDRPAYARAYSRGMFVGGGSLLLSGILALVWEGQTGTTLSLIVLFAGLIVSVAMFLHAQKKYNGGLF